MIVSYFSSPTLERLQIRNLRSSDREEVAASRIYMHSPERMSRFFFSITARKEDVHRSAILLHSTGSLYDMAVLHGSPIQTGVRIQMQIHEADQVTRVGTSRPTGCGSKDKLLKRSFYSCLHSFPHTSAEDSSVTSTSITERGPVMSPQTVVTKHGRYRQDWTLHSLFTRHNGNSCPSSQGFE